MFSLEPNDPRTRSGQTCRWAPGSVSPFRDGGATYLRGSVHGGC